MFLFISPCISSLNFKAIILTSHRRKHQNFSKLFSIKNFLHIRFNIISHSKHSWMHLKVSWLFNCIFHFQSEATNRRILCFCDNKSISVLIKCQFPSQKTRAPKILESLFWTCSNHSNNEPLKELHRKTEITFYFLATNVNFLYAYYL